jgi:cytochrome b6-f complex iron-sulfur subunit
MPIPKFTRREFCVHSCQTLSLAAIATSIGCGGSDSPTSPTSTLPALRTISAPVAGGVVTVTIDSTSPLTSVGSAALVNTSSGNFLVSRTGQDTFVALTAVCTHEGCVVSNFSSGIYECPCHGSQYNTSGAVQKGPATRALNQFATSFSNNVLTIRL